jgi:predicted acylesterase/phospholipase RssA
VTRVHLLLRSIGLAAALACGTARAAGSSPAGAGEADPARCRFDAVVRLGIVSFDDAPRDAEDLRPFLQKAADESLENAIFKCPVAFEVVVGNYYQILSWLESAQIDAAVVSPFLFTLLKDEGAVMDTPLLELAEWNLGRRYHLPTVTLQEHGERWAESHRDAPRELESLLCGLRRVAEGAPASNVTEAAPCPSYERDGTPVPPARIEDYELDLVSHLSTSGLVVPFLHAQRWLALQGVHEGLVVKRFWDELRKLIRFRLSHGAPIEPGSTKRFVLQFDEGMGDPRDHKGAVYDRAIHIPNDVLALRAGEEKRLFAASFDRATLRADRPPHDDDAPGVPCPCPDPGSEANSERRPFALGCLSDCQATKGQATPAHGYAEALPVSRVLESFDNVADALFASGSLQDLRHEWYEQRQFTFTLDETLDFLRKDQKTSTSDALALVLPGGGVKATYQAVLLDHLYDDGLLVNAAAGATAGDVAPTRDAADPKPLKTTAVIGTSGGALMGLFTALLDRPPAPAAKAERDRLTGLWIRGNEVRTKDSLVFPWMSVPRYVSLWLLLAIVALVFFVASRRHRARALAAGAPADADEPPSEIADNHVGYYVSGVLLLLVAVTPILVKVTIAEGAGAGRNPSVREYAPIVEGFLYTALLVLTHCLWTCGQTRRSQQPPPRPRWALRAAAWLLAVAVVRASMDAAGRGSRAHLLGAWELWWPSLGIVAGALLVLGSLFVEALVAGGGFDLKDARKYLRAMAVLGVILLVALSLFGIGVTCQAYTYLELTGTYWLAIAAAGVAAALLALLARRLVARRGAGGRGSWLVASIDYLRTEQPFMQMFRSSPIWTFTFVDFAGLALWLGLVAPALYSNAKAIGFLGEQVRDAGYDAKALALKATLIVTTTNLTRVAADGALLPPDYYFCFGERCGDGGGPGWFPFPATTQSLDNIIDPVFASGSPFPIFPGHFVRRNEFRLSLIDGGFAHNTPIEAAGHVHCRQVLLINSSPASDDPNQLQRDAGHSHYGSELLRNLELLPGFLFDRSQETDRLAGRGLVVLALTPRDDGQDPPFLADFRPDVVKRMKQNANHDIKNVRIGSIVSVGVPGPPLLQIRRTDPDRATARRKVASQP